MDLNDRLYIATFSYDAIEAAKEYGLKLEINDTCISENMDSDKIRETRNSIRNEILESGGRQVIFHGPFTEINPGAIDHRAVDLGMSRLSEAYSLIRDLGADKMVVHSGYIPFIYFKEWHIEKSKKFWESFMADKPAGFRIYVENVLEDEPYMMAELIDSIEDDRIKLCLDLGHAAVKTRDDIDVYQWIRVLGKRIGHFHIHNNDGMDDLHEPINMGQIDYDKVFKFIDQYCDDDVTVTIESHHSIESVKWLIEKGLINGK